MWSLQRGSEEPMVERVCISEELGATAEGTKVNITWTSGAPPLPPCHVAVFSPQSSWPADITRAWGAVTMDALKLLPEFASDSGSDMRADSSSADGTSRVLRALARLKTIMGCGAQEELLLKPFTQGGVEADAGVGQTADSGTVLVLDVESNVWVERDAALLRVGDVVRVLKTQKFPADLILLHASSPTEVCIETSCFDNDSSLRHWQCVPASLTARDLTSSAAAGATSLLDALGSGDPQATQELRDADMTFKVRPSRMPAEWETWKAVMYPSAAESKKGVQEVTFGYRQLLPWQAKLLVTDWVVGLVVFQGEDTCWALSGGSAACERQARRIELQVKSRVKLSSEQKNKKVHANVRSCALQKKHEAAVRDSAKTKQLAEEAARPPLEVRDTVENTMKNQDNVY